jgi:hypothetical protein
MCVRSLALRGESLCSAQMHGLGRVKQPKTSGRVLGQRVREKKLRGVPLNTTDAHAKETTHLQPAPVVVSRAKVNDCARAK